jgi:hypothetical protein
MRLTAYLRRAGRKHGYHTPVDTSPAMPSLRERRNHRATSATGGLFRRDGGKHFKRLRSGPGRVRHYFSLHPLRHSGVEIMRANGPWAVLRKLPTGRRGCWRAAADCFRARDRAASGWLAVDLLFHDSRGLEYHHASRRDRHFDGPVALDLKARPTGKPSGNL